MPREGSIAESAKQRSLRVPLDHYEQPNALVRGKWKVSVIVALLTVVYVVWLLVGGRAAKQQVSSGRLAAAHASWNDDCLACHKGFEPLRSDSLNLAALFHGGESRRQSLDEGCIKCHNTPVHHAAAKENEVPNCAACHRDHKGLTADIVRPTDANCLACHRDIEAHRNGKSGMNPQVANITRFRVQGSGFSTAEGTEDGRQETGNRPHPDFRSLESDPGNIKFNHWLHMQPGIAARDAKKQLKLADLDASWQTKYANYGKPDGLVQLDCAACHQPDANGAYMRPIAFEEHCRACHRLELRVAEGAAVAEVPHGLSAERLRTVVSGLLLAGEQRKAEPPAASADESGALPLVPGKTLGANLAQKISADVLGRRDLATREIATKCMECHHSRSSASVSPSDAMDVLPPTIPQVWLRHSRFDHRAHRHVECRNCHAAAYAYEQHDKPQFLAPPEGGQQARDGEQVMIAGIENCASCHAPASGKTGGARYDCSECHRYHGGDAAVEGSGFRAPPEGWSQGSAAGRVRGSGFRVQKETGGRGQGAGDRQWLSLVSLAPAADAKARYVGAWSCASAGCHGDVRGGGPEWRSAFTTWATVDPHAQAFEVLWTFRGREMTRLLEGKRVQGSGFRVQQAENNETRRQRDKEAQNDDGQLSDAEHFAVLQRRCIGCHATPSSRGSSAAPEEYALGVSCESCHGPAGDWLHPHYRSGFARDTAGFVNTKESLNERAATCMKCHVGPSDEFGSPHIVDHDLIAAGHPRLSFEFHSYFESKPAHWNRLVDEKRPPGVFHFASWLAGQIEQRKQAQMLAEGTQTIDFAQLDCMSCHHELTANSWRQKSRSQILELATWPSTPLPSSAESLSSPERAKLLTEIFSDRRNFADWEAAVQCYLAAGAFLGDLKNAAAAPAAEVTALRAAVADLGKFLASDCFTALSSNKRRPTTYDSPTGYSPAALAGRMKPVQDALTQLQARLGAP